MLDILFVFIPDFFNKFATLAKYSPFLPLLNKGQTKFQPVYVNDIAKAVRKLVIAEKSCNGKIYELGGSDIFTFKELIELTLKYSNQKRILLNFHTY